MTGLQRTDPRHRGSDAGPTKRKILPILVAAGMFATFLFGNDVLSTLLKARSPISAAELVGAKPVKVPTARHPQTAPAGSRSRQTSSTSVFFWTDSEGQRHYSSKPPEEADETVYRLPIDGSKGISFGMDRSGVAEEARSISARAAEGSNSSGLSITPRQARSFKASSSYDATRCESNQEALDNHRARMRLGYKASEYNTLMARENELKERIREFCRE